MSIPISKLREDFSAVIATVRKQAFVHVNVVPHIVKLGVGDIAIFAHKPLILSVCIRVQLSDLVKAWIIVCKRLPWLNIGVVASCDRIYLLTKIMVIVLRYSCAYVWLLVLDQIHCRFYELLHHQVIIVGRTAQENLECNRIFFGKGMRSESFDVKAFHIQIPCQC